MEITIVLVVVVFLILLPLLVLRCSFGVILASVMRGISSTETTLAATSTGKST